MIINKKNIKTILDIGSNKVICFIFEFSKENQVKILGVGHQISKGIKNGIIVNIEEAQEPISKAVNTAEKMSGITIDNVIVNISERNLKSFYDNISIDITGESITLDDISTLLNKACNKYKNEQYDVIHCIPIEYSVDMLRKVENPNAMKAETLSVNVHIITCKIASLLCISQCLSKCFLNIEDYVSSAYASSLSCLSKNDKELGSILIEIGYDTTSIAAIKNNKLIHVNSIPIGGMHVTNDLALCLSIEVEDAERLKTLHSNLISIHRDDQEIIDIQQIINSHDKESSAIPKSHINNIIKPRIEEILNIVKDKVTDSNIINSINTIVITGGSSQFTGLKELTSKIFDKPIYINAPSRVEGLAESIEGPEFATIIGMITYVTNKPSFYKFYTYKKQNTKSSFIKKIFQFIKNNL